MTVAQNLLLITTMLGLFVIPFIFLFFKRPVLGVIIGLSLVIGSCSCSDYLIYKDQYAECMKELNDDGYCSHAAMAGLPR